MEERPVKCFQHCTGATNILCFSLPETCPICDQEIRRTESRIPPYIIASPFVDAKDTRCCLVIKPTRGSFLGDFDNSSDLHVGITDSKGRVYEYDENGITVAGPNWFQCICVKLIGLTQKPQEQWDRCLQEFVHFSNWSKERYNEDTNNCFDFVIHFLCHFGMDRLYPCLSDRLAFCKELILPRTHKAGQYISLYRNILSNGLVLQEVKSMEGWNSPS